MTLKTRVVGFLQYAQGDDVQTYLQRWLAQSWRSTDGLFDPVSGHSHNGSGTNGPVVAGGGLLSVLQLAEQSAAPATPPAGQVSVYAKTDHRLYMKDSTGAEIPLANVWGSP